MTGYGILVGYDGSLGSVQALVWAAGEARLRGTALTVCHAWTPWYSPWPADGAMAAGSERTGPERILATGTRLARGLLGGGQVRPLLAVGSAAAILCEHASDADILVVGSGRHSGAAGLLLGSVSSQVAAHAPGPAVVVPRHWALTGGGHSRPVVVGVGGSSSSETAVAFAFAEARLRGVPVLAVCGLAGTPGGIAAVRRLQDEFDCLLDRWEKAHPEVPLRRQVSVETPAAALLAAAPQAQLVVVGSGGSWLHRLLHGSVSHALLEHAPCPVSVTHPRSRPASLGRAGIRDQGALTVGGGRWRPMEVFGDERGRSLAG